MEERLGYSVGAAGCGALLAVMAALFIEPLGRMVADDTITLTQVACAGMAVGFIVGWVKTKGQF